MMSTLPEGGFRAGSSLLPQILPARRIEGELARIAAQRYAAVCSGAGAAELSALDHELSACRAG
jgi:hypothetical protein